MGEHTGRESISYDRYGALDSDVRMLKNAVLGDGNGMRGLTTRTSLVERSVEDMGKNLSRLLWLVLTTCLTVLGDIIVHGVLHR